MTDAVQTRRCPSCRRAKDAGKDFYAGCTECKACKRGRSKANREVLARKLDIAERLIEALLSGAVHAGQQMASVPLISSPERDAR